MRKWAEILAISGLVAVMGVISCGKTEIYDIPSQETCRQEGKPLEQCCRIIKGCGKLCYEGFTADGSGFVITMNNQKFMYSTAQEDMYPCGCPLERGAISDDLLVVVQHIKPFDLP